MELKAMIGDKTREALLGVQKYPAAATLDLPQIFGVRTATSRWPVYAECNNFRDCNRRLSARQSHRLTRGLP